MITDSDNKLYEAYQRSVLQNRHNKWELVKIPLTKKRFLENQNKDE